MVQQEPIRRGSAPLQEIPDKLYFRIGEVAKLCAVPAYVLRFWEGEFPQLKPNKGGTGQRLYRRRDVETALRVKSLLYDEGYTIPGARTALKAELRGAKVAQIGLGIAEEVPSALDMTVVRKIKKELGELVLLLSEPPVKPGANSSVYSILGGRLDKVGEVKSTSRSTVRAFPKPKTVLYDSFDRLFDAGPENEPVK